MPVTPHAGRAPLDDLATPLAEVTFAVVDLETTGSAPEAGGITEIGALKIRGGECLGTFRTLVHPGRPLPRFVTVLTGITEPMVVGAPTIAEVLPSLAEFLGGAVVVGHNVAYDIAFLEAAFAAHGYPGLHTHRRVDTLALARRLVRDEVDDLRLGTLARHLRVPTTPTHRALDDARATAEVFHALLERAGTLDVLALDDLLELPAIRAHPTSHKLKLTTRLPRSPGVYLLRDRAGRVLYAGRASRNVRGRVRRHFAGDGRRTVPLLLRHTEAIDHVACAHPLEAAVRQLRLIRDHEPRFNPEPKAWRRRAYIELRTNGRAPRLVVVRRALGPEWLGPLPSMAVARLVRDTLVAAVAKADLVDVIGRGLGPEPRLLPELLTGQIAELVAAERFEDASNVREGRAALAGMLSQRRRLEAARTRGTVTIEGLEIAAGRLVLPDEPVCRPPAPAGAAAELDERLAVACWLERRALPRVALAPLGALPSGSRRS